MSTGSSLLNVSPCSSSKEEKKIMLLFLKESKVMVLRTIILQKEYGCSHLDEWSDGVAYERREMVHTLFQTVWDFFFIYIIFFTTALAFLIGYSIHELSRTVCNWL